MKSKNLGKKTTFGSNSQNIGVKPDFISGPEIKLVVT